MKLPLLALVLLVAGCRSPVRVQPVSEEEVRSELQRFALTGDDLSVWTTWVLQLMEGEELFEEDPLATLTAIHALHRQGDGRQGSFILAELSYLAGRRLGSRDCYLAAAIYAYDFLLGERGPPPSPWDRRFRWACDLYNSAVARAFHNPDKGLLDLTGGTRNSPAGAVQVVVDTTRFPFQTEGIQLHLADELSVIGLDYRVRDSGLGAPVIAVAKQREEGSGVGVQDETRVPGTVFLRVEGDAFDSTNELIVHLELHSTYDVASVEVGELVVPLEADLSSALAADMESSGYWRFNIKGFLQGAQGAQTNGLILNRPFEPGRIPVVLVHGTASNPSAWAGLINALTADRELRGRYQFWLYMYSTGNPIMFSAATLRQQLTELVEKEDPDGKDEALRSMVLIGHSQGGLLIKTLGQSLRAETVTEELLGVSMDDLELSDKDDKLMRRLFDFDPLPFVERLVFISTPHGGSFLADRWYARVAAKMVSMPSELLVTSERILKRMPAERIPGGIQPRISTSLDNMRPDNPGFQFMSSLEIDPRIKYNSIIPIGDFEQPEGANDGVVEYESAHLDGAESEALIPSPHSCQGHPRTIIEVRRILREHAQFPVSPIRPLELPTKASE